MVARSTLDVITVIKNPGPELSLTIISLIEVANLHKGKVRWIVIDGSEKAINKINELMGPSDEYLKVDYLHELDDGIYAAMNKGLAKVQSDYFVFINSGDTLDKNIFNVLSEGYSKVASCQSSWHDEFGNLDRSISSRRTTPWLGIMPNHQGMIFPNEYRKLTYSTRWKISSDQDLKLKLWSKNEIIFSQELISSCLIGGISMRRLTLKQIILRSRESGQVFRQHFTFLHALFLNLVYFVRYLNRWNGKIFHY